MSEPEPMRQIHEIQEKIYEETKHMSGNERLGYFHKKSEQFEEEMKSVKPAKDLQTFFANLRKNK